MSLSKGLIVVAVWTLAGLGIVAHAHEGERKKSNQGEKKLTVQDLPAAVQATIQKAIGTGQVAKVSKETEDDKTIYEAEWSADKIAHSITVSDAGALLEEETAIDLKGLPAAASETILRRFGTVAQTKGAESVKKGDTAFFEVVVKYGKEEHEVKVDASGVLLSDVVEPQSEGKEVGEAEEDEESEEAEEQEEREHEHGSHRMHKEHEHGEK